MTALLALAHCGLRVLGRRDPLDAYLASAPAGDDSAERLRRGEEGRGVGAEELEAPVPVCVRQQLHQVGSLREGGGSALLNGDAWSFSAACTCAGRRLTALGQRPQAARHTICYGLASRAAATPQY